MAHESGSWRVGAVRMTERFLPNGGPAKPRQIEALREHVTQELGSATWLTKTGRRLVGIGGTVRGLAAVAQRAEGLPSNGVQGMTVTREALGEIIERLAALAPSQRASVPGVKPARADLILAGAVVVEGALRAGGFEVLEATEAGLREGVFFERHLLRGARLPAFGRVRHPLGDRTPPPRRALAVRGRAPGVGGEPRRALSRGPRPHATCGGAGARHVRPAGAHGPAQGRPGGAGTAVGGVHAARHRDVGGLRRSPQALALSDPQRGSAGVLPDGGGDRGAGGALPPQGHARPGAACGAVRRGRRGEARPLRRAAAPGGGPRALARPARQRHGAQRRERVGAAAAAGGGQARRCPAGRRVGRASCSRARSTRSCRWSRRSGQAGPAGARPRRSRTARGCRSSSAGAPSQTCEGM